MDSILYYRKLKYETRLWCISQQVSILAPAESFLAVTEEHTIMRTPGNTTPTPAYYGYLCGNYSDYINEQLYCCVAVDDFENDVKYSKEMVDDICRHTPCLMLQFK